MSKSKGSLLSYQVATNWDISQSQASVATNINRLDNVGYQVNWSGSPSGTFSVQISADYSQDFQGNILNPGNWITLLSEVVPTATSPIYFDLTQLSAPWVRLIYTATSGTGLANAYVTAKEI